MSWLTPLGLLGLIGLIILIIIYIVKPKVVGFLGTYNEEYFLIRFDENGVAYDCEYVVTGAGG